MREAVAGVLSRPLARFGRSGGLPAWRFREKGSRRVVSEPLLTARRVAELVGVHVETILRWTRRGELPAVRLPGGALRFREAELEAWLDGRATAAPVRGVRTTQTGTADARLSSTPRTTPPLDAATTEEEPSDATR